MTFEVIVRKKVIKKINQISPYRDKIIVALSSLESNAFPKQYDIRKLKGKDDTFRIRIGNIRIIYKVLWNDRRIYVDDVDLRENIY